MRDASPFFDKQTLYQSSKKIWSRNFVWRIHYIFYKKFTILNCYCFPFVAIVLLFAICPNMVKSKVWCRARKLTELIGLQKTIQKTVMFMCGYVLIFLEGCPLINDWTNRVYKFEPNLKISYLFRLRPDFLRMPSISNNS